MRATESVRLSSGEVHRKPLEISERAMLERAFVRGAQDHARRLARREGLLPARRAQAPAVAGLEPAEAELRDRRGKIVAGGFGEREKFDGHDGTNRVAADVLLRGIAAAVAEEAGHRLDRADFEPLA